MEAQLSVLVTLLNGSEVRICKAAVEKVEDQALLANIAASGANEQICGVAVERVSDQGTLAGIAKDAPIRRIQTAALERLLDPMIAAEFARDISDEPKFPGDMSGWDRVRWLANIAVSKVEDHAILADIAKNATHSAARRAAIDRVVDEAVLADVVKNDLDECARRKAIKKIHNQSLLADVAKEDSDRDVRVAAVKNITDQAVLTVVAKSDLDASVRGAAAYRVTDRAVRADIAKNDTDPGVRKSALASIKYWVCPGRLDQADQVFLADFAKIEMCQDLQEAAIKRIDDQALLGDIAMNANLEQGRRLAVELTQDQDALVKVATNDPSDSVRRAAFAKIPFNEKLCVHVATSDAYLGLIALERLVKHRASSDQVIECFLSALEHESHQYCEAAVVGLAGAWHRNSLILSRIETRIHLLRHEFLFQLAHEVGHAGLMDIAKGLEEREEAERKRAERQRNAEQERKEANCDHDWEWHQAPDRHSALSIGVCRRCGASCSE